MRKLKSVPMIIAAAGMAVGVMAVDPQTTQDYADGNRLVINGKPLFISGMNIAWNSFGNDLSDASTIDELKFRKYIQDVRAAGGNAVRWWLHNDASRCPKIDANGNVTGLATYSIESMRKVLDIAYENGVVVAMCLFSHNLFVPGSKSTWSDYDIDRNYKLFTNADKMDTYITNGLRPILQAVGSHPAVMCWEVFNEPEGMTTEHGWSDMAQKIPYTDVIKFTAKVAAEVHKRTKKMASTGIHEFNKTNYFPKYTEANLKAAAGNDPDAYLDFYMAHYYPEFQGTGPAMSPFQNNAAHWGLDKPVLIGEFPGRSWAQMTITDAFNYAYNNGYVGALSWAITDAANGSIEETAPGLTSLYNSHRNDIMIKDVNIVEPTGDLVMKLVFNAQQTGDANEALLKKELSNVNLQGKTNFTFDMYIDPSSGSSLQLYPAFQGNVASEWGWYDAAALNLGSYTKGQWVNVTVPINAFEMPNGTGIAAAFLKFVASGTAFTGVIYIDNIKIDNDVLSDFDDSNAWGRESGAALSLDIVTRASVSGGLAVLNGGKTAVSTGPAPSVVVEGKILNVLSKDNAEMRIRMVDMRGKAVASFKSSGGGQFSLAKIPAGRYIVETRIAGKRASSTAVMVR